MGRAFLRWFWDLGWFGLEFRLPFRHVLAHLMVFDTLLASWTGILGNFKNKLLVDKHDEYSDLVFHRKKQTIGREAGCVAYKPYARKRLRFGFLVKTNRESKRNRSTFRRHYKRSHTVYRRGKNPAVRLTACRHEKRDHARSVGRWEHSS